MSHEQFKALYHFLNGRDTFARLPTGHGKTLIYQIAVLVARTGKVKILPSNALAVVVSPLNALTSDQLESCQRLKVKAVKMEQELFDNDATYGLHSFRYAATQVWNTLPDDIRTSESLIAFKSAIQDITA